MKLRNPSKSCSCELQIPRQSVVLLLLLLRVGSVVVVVIAVARSLRMASPEFIMTVMDKTKPKTAKIAAGTNKRSERSKTTSPKMGMFLVGAFLLAVSSSLSMRVKVRTKGSMGRGGGFSFMAAAAA